jgi:hypothetical protein
MTTTARARSRRTAATAGPPPAPAAKPQILTSARLARHLQVLRHRAAICDYLARQVGDWFVAPHGEQPPLLIEAEAGGLERADIDVVVGLGVELASRAEQEHERIRTLLSKDIRSLTLADAPIDEGVELPAYRPSSVARNPKVKA